MDKEKIIRIIDELIFEAQKEPTWGAENALMCLKKELLKEQEPVEPIKMQRMDGNFSFFVPYFLCGNCRYELVGKDVMFCHHCGQAVKWE